MAIVLGLLSALAYGASDFVAGLMTRRGGTVPVSAIGQSVGLLVAVPAVLLVPAALPTGPALAWGAASGLGSGIGTLALYRGLAVGRMTVVAPLSGVGAAVVPAVLGLALGEPLSPVAIAGIVLAIPAIVLVSLHASGAAQGARWAGVPEGLASGAGFALLFVGLDRAGTGSGAWPLLAAQVVAVTALVGVGLATRRLRAVPRALLPGIVLFGALGGIATLLYLLASGMGYLAVVAVLASLYPAVTVLCARVLLGERWNAVQLVGLGASAVAVALIALG